jgi:peptidoglycan lytic transglycosylase
MVPPLLGSALSGCRISVGWGYNMSSISRARTSFVDVKANRIHRNASLVSVAGVRNIIQLSAVVLGAASLAACAQPSVVTQKTELPAAHRKASLEHNRKTSFATNRHLGVTKRHTLFTSNKTAAKTQIASHGIASFYTTGTKTANGERFDTNQLTAAHRTLPFGTRLRVTNVATGQSVTVRVNDRGPFIPGRVVDVSYSAATTLGMVGGGIAKVKLEVVE